MIHILSKTVLKYKTHKAQKIISGTLHTQKPTEETRSEINIKLESSDDLRGRLHVQALTCT